MMEEPGYVFVPRADYEPPTLQYLLTYGLRLYYVPYSTDYNRYVISPPLNNGEYPVKIAFYRGTQSDVFWMFLATIDVDDPNASAYVYDGNDIDTKDPEKTYLNNKYTASNGTKLRGYNVSLSTVYEPNPLIPFHSTFEDCLDAIADDNWSGDSDYDPFSPGGNSSTGGGTGSFDGTGDSIAVPGLPTLSAVDTGFITLFNPTLYQIRDLCSYMWSDLFDLDSLKKLFADPMQAILGLSIVPVAVPNSGAREVKVGNISTGVSMNVATQQYVTVDCGTLNVNEYWGAYLDYDPYTKAEIYLPYIGTHAIAVDDIMNKPVHVVYNIDILSGACCAHIKCGDSVLYSFMGQCSAQIPITGNDWGSVINGALSIAGAIGSMVATGGASAPLAVSAIASTAVNSVKPNIEKSGAMSGSGGMLGVQIPYLILTRPRQALPVKQNEFMGYPAFIASKLADLTGYTEVETVHLDNIPATDAELSEIETLLKGGVIL